jgi:hypothetical protein
MDGLNLILQVRAPGLEVRYEDKPAEADDLGRTP